MKNENLDACFKDTSDSLKTQKETMWRPFHQLQTSADFKNGTAFSLTEQPSNQL